MADAKVLMEKLGETNYATWSYLMELVLIKEDLLEMVTCDKPENPSAAWLSKDGKARAAIGLALQSTQLVHVMKAKTAREMWDSLKNFHQRRSLVNKIHVLRKLIRLQLDEDGNMAEHVATVTELANRLEALGESLSNHWIVAFFSVESAQFLRQPHYRSRKSPRRGT